MAALTYTMYRATTVGETLERTLEEFVEDGRITQSLVNKIMTNFDKSITQEMNSGLKQRFTFKANKLLAYRFCDNVWTFVMEQTELKESTAKPQQPIDRLKIVACDAAKKS